MPQATEVATKANTSSRAERAPGPGSAVDQDTSAAVLLSPDDVRLIGKTLGGEAHWQADLARRIGYSKSNITRYLNGSRPTNPLLAQQMRKVILERIAALTDLLNTPGLPAADHIATKTGQTLIRQGLSTIHAHAHPKR